MRYAGAVALRSNAARRWAIVAAVATVAGACHLLVPAGDEIKRRPDASGPSVVPPIDAGVDPCGPIPEPPARRDDPSGPTLTFAAIKWALDPAGDDTLCQSRGFDLDGLKTGPPPQCEVDRACTPLPESNGQHVSPCDGPNGEDSALFDVLGFVRTLPTGASDSIRAYDFNRAISAGLSTSLIEIHDYSGESDDERVMVHLYGAVGIEGHDAGVLKPSEVPSRPEIWDGGQDFAWIVSEESLEGEGVYAKARVRAEGYVRDRVLVVRHTGPLRLPFILAGKTASARAGTLMGRLEPPRQPGDRYRLTHVRVGVRFAGKELLSVIGAAHDPTQSWLQLCSPQSRGIYEGFFRASLCARVDLPAGNEPPDAAAMCGDISAGIHAEYVNSRLSRTEDGLVVGKNVFVGTRLPCPDDAGNEWCDDCAWDAASRCPVEGDGGT